MLVSNAVFCQVNPRWGGYDAVEFLYYLDYLLRICLVTRGNLDSIPPGKYKKLTYESPR